jgi:hypothetical protein
MKAQRNAYLIFASHFVDHSRAATSSFREKKSWTTIQCLGQIINLWYRCWHRLTSSLERV